jgi:hypothetical protein
VDENQPETPAQWLERQYDQQAARMAEPSGRSAEERAAQAERILAGMKEQAGQPLPDGNFRDVTVAFTSDEAILLSNVLRRQEPGGLFTGQPTYATLFAKCASFDWPMLGWPAALEDAREMFPVTAEGHLGPGR